MSNSLAAVHPELIVEWSDRNLPLTPDSVTFGSNKKVWWKGACGHEWETSIKARSSGVSVSIILQNLAQLKALFEKQWESIVGNCVRPEVASAL